MPNKKFQSGQEQNNRGDRRIQIHSVIDSPETGHWLHTHGMDRLGLPELEIRGVPSYLIDAAAGVLNQVCDYMQELDDEVRLGQTMQVGPHSSLRLLKLPPIPDCEDHYEVERWAFVPDGVACSEGGHACPGHSQHSAPLDCESQLLDCDSAPPPEGDGSSMP